VADGPEVRVALVELADKVASKAVSGPMRQSNDEARYLEAFRVAFRHLVQSASGDPASGRETETAKAADVLWPKK
jgi:hypothetical protein